MSKNSIIYLKTDRKETSMENVKILFKHYWKYIFGIIVGLVGGYLYWVYIEHFGARIYESTPVPSMIWWGVIGFVVTRLLDKVRKNKR